MNAPVHTRCAGPGINGLLGRQLVAQVVPGCLAGVGHGFDEVGHGVSNENEC